MPQRMLLPPSLGAANSSARAELLSDWLNKRLQTTFEVVVAESYEDLEAQVSARAATLAWVPPLLCARIADEARAIFKAVRGGRSEYRAALIGRRIDNLSMESIAGKRAAWVDQRSVAGYLLAVALMRKHGLAHTSVLAEERFVGSFRRAVRAVLDGDADLTAVFVHDEKPATVAESLEQAAGAAAAKRLHAFAFTDTAPTDALVLLRDEREGGLFAHELAGLVSAPTSQNMLIATFNAEALVRAHPGEYAFLSALS